MIKFRKKDFYQITTNSFMVSQFSLQKMNKNYSIYFSSMMIFLMIVSSFFPYALGADDRIRLETELVNPSTGRDDGKAKYEQRDDRSTFSLEIEGQSPNSIYEIKVDDKLVRKISTDGSGFADLDIDSRDGDAIPPIKLGSWVQVIDSIGKVVLSGKMNVIGNTQPNLQTPQTGSEPVSTTSVTIPLGSKDKNVSEFFVPSTISVNLYDTITWTNKDDTEHTVTSQTNIFNSGLIESGQSFSHQFSQDGTFEYFCQLHPWMVGTVVAGKGGSIPIPDNPQSIQPQANPEINPKVSDPSSSTVTIPAGAAEQKIAEYFSPKSITIKTSDSVLWKNSDIGFHTVTSGKGTSDGIFDSSLFGPEQTFSFQFKQSGTFDYFCTVHQWMTGSISVLPMETIQSDNISEIQKPFKQVKSGVDPKDVVCKPGKKLSFKVSDDMPVCLFEKSVLKLLSWGWVKITPSLDDFKETLSKTIYLETIISKFGTPHKDIGSGIHIYIYELDDSTQIWIGYTDQILYTRHVDSDGKILEELFEGN